VSTWLLSLITILTVAAVSADDLDELQVELKSSNKWSRKSAVEKLARLGTPDAWEEVVRALDDPKGEVADTAQLVLAGLTDPESLEFVLGRRGLDSKDEWVRARAVEALGRMSVPLPARGLRHALGDGDPEVRRMACWTVERRADGLDEGTREELLTRLLRLIRGDRDHAVRARALHALMALAPAPGTEAVRAAARDPQSELRCAAAALTRDEGLLEALAADPVLAVRTRAVRTLGEVATRRAARVLVQHLADEPEERLGIQLVEVLQRLSGLKHRRDPRPWRDWADRLPEGWRGRTAPPSPGAPGAPGEGAALSGNRSVALAGLPILSGRLAFLVDLSGSIWNEREDGTTKKEIIDGKLAEVFERLPESTLFNVIPFTGKPHPWQDELVPATRKNVKSAIRFFERCREQGSGNFWDAAMLALEDPEVDTLLVLTDGLPTGGRRYQLELIVPLFLELNATRQIAVDSILVDAPGKLRGHWAALAEGTGGRSIAIEL